MSKPTDTMARELTPKQIVAELDKFIVGQEKAKRSVAVALRNRYRRRMMDEDLQDEVSPKNILMIGPTGVGKTEIARRLARLVQAPFIKVEATKFTEVGYVGRDVESMVRDLVEMCIRMVKNERVEAVQDRAAQRLRKAGASSSRQEPALELGVGEDELVADRLPQGSDAGTFPALQERWKRPGFD